MVLIVHSTFPRTGPKMLYPVPRLFNGSRRASLLLPQTIDFSTSSFRSERQSSFSPCAHTWAGPRCITLLFASPRFAIACDFAILHLGRHSRSIRACSARRPRLPACHTSTVSRVALRHKVAAPPARRCGAPEMFPTRSWGPWLVCSPCS